MTRPYLLRDFKAKLWLTYCAWLREPLEPKLLRTFAETLPPASELNLELEDFLASSGQSNVPMRELYIFIRGLRPAVVIETGVARGGSTATILAALEKNNSGELHSIDATAYLEPKENMGYTTEKLATLVPSRKHPRWHFHEGLSTQILPELLNELKKSGKDVDFFLHDSDHGYDCVKFELEIMQAAIKKGGFIGSHDAFCFGNKPAFLEFEREHPEMELFFEGKAAEYRLYQKNRRPIADFPRLSVTTEFPPNAPRGISG